MLVAQPRPTERYKRRSADEITASAAIRQKPGYVPDRLARSRIKITLGAFAVVIACEVLAGYRPRSPLDFSDPWVIAGGLAVGLGLAVRTWAAGTLIKKKRLACDGPYSLVRHPLYLGSSLMMLGFTVLTGMWWNVALAAVLAALFFGHAIRTEESFLAARFGERWNQYAARTGRLLPRSIAGRVLAPWSWQRWLRNREFNAWAGSLLGWLGLLAWWWR